MGCKVLTAHGFGTSLFAEKPPHAPNHKRSGDAGGLGEKMLGGQERDAKRPDDPI